jgi:leucyl-tRNA synthetase
MIARYGADTVRLFCLFAAPPERDFDWSDAGIEGSFRFLQRVWRLFMEERPHLSACKACSSLAEDADSPLAREIRFREHAAVKKVSEDIGERRQFNTAVAAVMEFVNALYAARAELNRNPQGRRVFSSAVASALTLLCPFTPHLCEELWAELGHTGFLSAESWPEWRQDALVRDLATIVVQVDGKLRGKLEVSPDTDKAEIEKAALAEPAVAARIAGRVVRRVLVVPGKLVNIVTA